MASQILGKVEIQPGTQIKESIVKGPVSIGRGCMIKNSLVGPLVSIGAGATIEDSKIERSIILEGCQIYQTSFLFDSVIGKNTKIIMMKDNSREITLLVGENARVEL